MRKVTHQKTAKNYHNNIDEKNNSSKVMMNSYHLKMIFHLKDLKFIMKSKLTFQKTVNMLQSLQTVY